VDQIVSLTILLSCFYPNWPPHGSYSGSDEIRSYFEWATEKLGVGSIIKTSHKMIEARWNEEEAKWHFKVEGPNGVFEDEADIFCNGSGILNNWKW
jgi:cation diffusion facilitator CzcD-associated flavoprotein CzcO